MRFVRPRKPRRDDAFPVVWSPRLLALWLLAPTQGEELRRHSGVDHWKSSQIEYTSSACFQKAFKVRTTPFFERVHFRRHCRTTPCATGADTPLTMANVNKLCLLISRWVGGNRRIFWPSEVEVSALRIRTQGGGVGREIWAPRVDR